VQYERALSAESNPDQPMPYSNSAYYDSQLSLPNPHGARTPDNLSPSSTSESEVDSHLTTPETGPDVVTSVTSTKLQQQTASKAQFADRNSVDKDTAAADLSPMAAAIRLNRRTPPKLALERTAFGSAQRKQEHRKTFSADFSKFPLGFTQLQEK
jgi:hypothetical protein